MTFPALIITLNVNKKRRFKAKRILDLCLIVLSLPILIPTCFLLGLIVWLGFGRPSLFKQQRIGQGSRPFELLKFRTMTDARDTSGVLLPDCERLTPLGRFLRATSLDELPELVNVLRGEMSLVGPRPLLPQYLDRYTPRQCRRHDVPPGITGWAQINGRNALSWEAKFELDIWYVEHGSFWLDCKILLFTVWKVLRPQGITQSGQATVEEFFPARTERK